LNHLHNTPHHPARSSRLPIYWTAALCLLCSLPAHAQVVLAPTTPQIGSSDPVSSEPTVKRPTTTPCTVQLFTNESFNDFNNKDFTYTPPSGCPGPWSKVVFTADFTVTEGRQFDRTAQFFIGNAIVYFGTTAEPRAALSPSWHVESDVTDLSALFKTSQPGVASLGNFIGVSGGVTYNGYIYGNAALEFYPAGLASLDDLPKIVPDVVLPMPGNSSAYGLYTTTDVLANTFTLPKNIESAYLDVIAQSQSADEFWYLNAPNDVASELDSYGNTGFRETEISIDGKPAGLAPVYPWIYTGGIDPYLWEPTVGVQTLDFKPYRVNLTPFAGMLSDGQPHTVGLSVYNADSYFAATANLLLYLDHFSQQTSGAVTKNTLSAAPTPQVTENIKTDAYGNVSGTVLVDSFRTFSLAGYVNTSHGRVETTVDETADFGNYQTYFVNELQDNQTVAQLNGAYSVTHTKDGIFDLETDQLFFYPLTVGYQFTENSDGSYIQLAQAMQQDYVTEQKKLNGFTYYTQASDETVNSQDTLGVGATETHTGSSTAKYQETNSLGSCYSRQLTSSNSVLTGLTDGAACGGINKQ
jgi:hypothetical protein